MRKIIFLTFAFLAGISLAVYSQETLEIDSEVLAVKPEAGFFIIRAGNENGVELGDGLVVHRQGEKVAQGYIIEVRPDISAAEILNVEPNEEILEGDSILIVKQTGKPEPRKQPEQSAGNKEPQRPKSKWTTILGPESEVTPAISERPDIELVTSTDRPQYVPEVSIIEKGDVVAAVIDRDHKEVYGYARIVLIEEGFNIVSSNRGIGVLLATKPISLSVGKELWSDAKASIGHKVVLSLNIKSAGKGSEVRASAFTQHFQKNKHIKHAVTSSSRHYGELTEVVSKIKRRAEY